MIRDGHISIYLKSAVVALALLASACNKDKEIASNKNNATQSDVVTFNISTSKTWEPDIIGDGVESEAGKASEAGKNIQTRSESFPLNCEGGEFPEELLFMYMLEEDCPPVVDSLKKVTRTDGNKESNNDTGIYAIHNGNTLFMDNVRLYSDGTYSGEVKYWPGSGTLKFYAYRPYSSTIIGLNVSTETDGNKTKPKFTYTVPNDAAAQRDLMAGVSAEYNGDLSGNTDGEVEISISHLLSQIQVKVGTMDIGTIKSVKIKGVNNYGTRTIGDDNWSNVSGAATSVEYVVYQAENPNDDSGINVSSAGGNQVGSSLYLLPQTLPENATIEIVLKTTREIYTLTQTLKQFVDTWNPNKKYTYVISSPEDVEVEVTDDVLYDGTYPVKQNLKIKNVGLSAAYIRVAMVGNWVVPKNPAATISDEPTDVNDQSQVEICDSWKDSDGVFTGLAGTDLSQGQDDYWHKGSDGYYYYMQPVPRGAVITGPFEKYTLTAQAPQAGAYLELIVAVQAVYPGDAEMMYQSAPQEVKAVLFPNNQQQG